MKGIIAYTTNRIVKRKGMRLRIRHLNKKELQRLRMVITIKVSKPLQKLITDTSDIEAIAFAKNPNDTWFIIKKPCVDVSNRHRDKQGRFVTEVNA